MYKKGGIDQRTGVAMHLAMLVRIGQRTAPAQYSPISHHILIYLTYICHTALCNLHMRHSYWNSRTIDRVEHM